MSYANDVGVVELHHKRRQIMSRFALLFGLLTAACTASGVKITESSEASVRGVDVDGAAVVGPSRDSGVEVSNPDGGQLDAEVDIAVDAGSSDLADAGPGACYRDGDGDGVGAGDVVPCDSATSVHDGGLHTGDASIPGALVHSTGDCDDHDPRRAPTLQEACDGIDNDCDMGLDEAVKNECGGVCGRPFDHLPGDACNNGLLGACLRSGEYACQGDSAVACNAPQATGSSELCGDSIDNDCDGNVNEADAANAPNWYQDCDGDGYAAATTGAIKACTKPANAGACSWTSVVPSPSTKTNWDCDDSRSAYSPGITQYGLPPAGSTSTDLNCSGTSEKAPFIVGGTDGSYPRCASEDSTETCAYWQNANGDYTATLPACASSTASTRDAYGQTCAGGWCVGQNQFKGLQYCR